MLNLEDGTYRLSQKVGKELLRNSSEERISLVKGLLLVQLIPTYEISGRYAGSLHHRHLNCRHARTKCLQ